jgi:putative redox protein
MNTQINMASCLAGLLRLTCCHSAIGWSAVLAMLLANTGCVKQTSQNRGQSRYPVHVAIREVSNRIVEGTVRQHKLYVDQPKAFGADDTAPTPPETLAFALGSCVVSTGRLLATQKKIVVRSLSATVDGELDFARALGMQTDARAGFRQLSVSVSIDADLSADDKAAFLSEVSARCPMCDNLVEATPVSVVLRAP